MSRKGTSILPFAFIILVVSLGIISWNFYNTYFGSKYQATVFEHSKMDTMVDKVEEGKKFLKQSLIYSTHQATLESAAHGGVILTGDEVNSWICNNGPLLLPINYFGETRDCLQRYTKTYTNAYYSSLSTNLPVDMFKSPYEKPSRFSVSRFSVLAGDNDESFEVALDEGKMSLSAKNTKISDLLDQSETIDRNRFWYMWRNFYDWANVDIYGKGMCDCVTSCGSCNCAKKVAKKAFEDLQKRFDQYVTCKKTCNCCYSCSDSRCGVEGRAGCRVYCKLPEPDTCAINSLFITVNFWGPDKCNAICGKKCAIVKASFPPDENVFGKDTKTYTGRQVKSQNTKASSSSSPTLNDDEVICAPYFKENRLASVHTYSCTDRKHLIPTGDGLEPLTFKVKAFGGYYDEDGCGCNYACMNITEHPCPGLQYLDDCPSYSIYNGFQYPWLP